jgi:hypothetical protein
MQLTYRGASYESTPVEIAMSEGGVSGKYRGAEVKFSSPSGRFIPHSAVKLTYRGSAYLRFN